MRLIRFHYRTYTILLSILGALCAAWVAYGAVGAAANSSADVYDGTLHWQNWSWATNVSTQTVWPIYNGEPSLSVQFQGPWAALSFATDAFDTGGYNSLQFLVYPTGGPIPSLTTTVYGQDGNPIGEVAATDYMTPVGSGWLLVSIPLADLGAKDTTITRISIQDRTGKTQMPFNVAGVQFSQQAGQSYTATQTSDGFSAYVFDGQAQWANWSWNTNTFIQHQWPVYKGTASLGVQFQAPWAGLSFAKDGSVSGYDDLQFAFYTGQGPIPALRAIVYDSSGELGSVSVTKYITNIQNGWFEVSIPLTDLGASGKNVDRVSIQEDAGTTPQTFYVDQIRFHRN